VTAPSSPASAVNGCGGATLRTGSLRVSSMQASFELACMFLWEISMTHDDNDSGPVTFVDIVLVLLEDKFPWPATDSQDAVSGADIVDQLIKLRALLLRQPTVRGRSRSARA
jgi:hypothetical protein